MFLLPFQLPDNAVIEAADIGSTDGPPAISMADLDGVLAARFGLASPGYCGHLRNEPVARDS